MRVEALIALGGNLGDVRETFAAARSEIAALPNSEILASSLLYQSEAIGPAGQPDYLNAVLFMETSIPPLSLLEHLHAIETGHGRVRNETWGPRTLDLDLIDYGGFVLNTTELTLPHFEMQKRMFVLQPLCDIRPDWEHPHLKMTAVQLLGKLEAEGIMPLGKGEAW